MRAAVRRPCNVGASRVAAQRPVSKAANLETNVGPLSSAHMSAGVNARGMHRDVHARTASPQHTAAVRRKRLAVFVSGGGSNFKSIQQKCEDGTINADIVVRFCRTATDTPVTLS